MAKKKSSPKKSAQEKTIMVKIAGQVGHLAGQLAAGKDHLVEMAGDAIESVKSTIHNITSKESTPKKAAKAKAKKAITKTARPKAKPASSSAAKKTAPLKKSIKKASKSASARK